jgi:DNA-binding MarR family transcriptional regulator
VTQFTRLMATRWLEPVTVKRVAKAVVMDRTTLARDLKPLERQARMRIAPGEDRRERQVTVPTRGQQAWAEGFPLWEQVQSFSFEMSSA